MTLTAESAHTSLWRSYDFDLGIEGFRFSDLNRVRRLMDLDALFLLEIERRDPVLHEHFSAYRKAQGEGVDPKEASWILIEVSDHLGRFIARLFGVGGDHEALRAEITETGDLFVWKKRYLQGKVLRKAPPEAELDAMDLEGIERRYDMLVRTVFPGHRRHDPELALAKTGLRLLDLEEAVCGKFGRMPEGPVPDDTLARLEEVRREIQADDEAHAELGPIPEGGLQDRVRGGELVRGLLAVVDAWVRALAWHSALAERTAEWTSLRRPRKMDFQRLVEVSCPEPEAFPEQLETPRGRRRLRDGFDLTDGRMERREALSEVHYCIFCHEREKDTCARGFTAKGDAGSTPLCKPGAFRRNPLGVPLTGCPLDEHISEAHTAKSRGSSIGALAVVMVQNPLCPGTGHRICNDCMKGCIYQKQEPVNIPEIETRILTDVLDLPFGVEIYQLLTRWNPLNPRYPYPRHFNGKTVLVVGMGPAGYTLAHHLLQAGFGVVGIDGLKIEPLPRELVGYRRRVPHPIREYQKFRSRLDKRILRGFGGVSEYGITVRWDKNFLDLIYLTLLRRKKFRLFDGVRFGGTLTLDDAWALGFDHVAVAAGAGKPTIVRMKNNLARGVRKASDFLMQLQLTGAFKRSGLVNLQMRLPGVVIGGGLTAIDAATELLAYYPVQVEKVLERFERLKEVMGEEAVYERMSEEDRKILREQLAHGRAVRDERRKAWAERRKPDLARLVRRWGGVRIAYRKRMQDSPSYRLNHEEIIKALEEGVRFCECYSPVEVHTDEYGAAEEITCERMEKGADGRWRSTQKTRRFPARSILVAAGTHPNTIYERERPGVFKKDKWNAYFHPHKLERREDGTRELVPCEEGEIGFFTSYEKDGRYVTYYGDNHPNFAGNVVRAMASALKGFHQIADLYDDDVRALRPEDQPDREWAWVLFSQTLQDGLRVKVVDVVRLTDKIVEVIVRAPFAARNFKPGQFYRLQNYETYAPEVEGYRLTTEAIALTGAWVDSANGLLSMIVLEMGHSSRLCAFLRPGERVVVMGPTGAPTEIPENKTVLLLGGGLGNAVLFSIAQACKAAGNRVLYFAGYKHSSDLFKQQAIEDSTDVVIWGQDAGAPIRPRRPQDRTFTGNIVQALLAYAGGELGGVPIPLSEVDRVITIGSDRMMGAVKQARHGVLKPYLSGKHVAIGSMNSPMNCMMKEICASCLQRHVDPKTQKEEFVFSCFNQDQELDRVDFEHLHTRLLQNSMAEKLSNLWLDYLIRKREVVEVE